MILSAIAVVFLAWWSLNTWTYVEVGEHKVEVCYGKVTGNVLSNGLYFSGVNALCSYDNINTQEKVSLWEDVAIQTKDRMTSNMNLTVFYRLKESGLVQLRNDYGTEGAFFAKTLDQILPTVIKSQTRNIGDSADLVNEAVMSQLATNAKTEINERLSRFVDVREVAIKNISFDPKIIKQIDDTKQRQENEKREASQLEIEKTKLQKQVAASAAEAESASNQYTAQTKLADAALYVALKEAEAMEARAKVLKDSPALVEYMKAEATKIEAERWDGKRTLTHQIVATPLTTIK